MKIEIRPIILSLLSLLFLFYSNKNIAADYAKTPGVLYAGVATIDITPPDGITLSGYGERSDIKSKGIHDPIYIKVLVLEVDGNRFAIISCDLINYYNKTVLDVAREKYNIPHVLISFSHTHGGPNLSDSKAYAVTVEKAMIDGLGKAVDNMFPAKISAGSKSFPQLGYNRITNRGDQICLWRNYERIPYGPVDPRVGIIKVEDYEGNPRIILMNYACHPVVNGHTLYVSADYPGIASRKVEENFGKNAVCMFIQGGAGDVNPMFMVDDAGFYSGRGKNYIPG